MILMKAQCGLVKV